LQKSGTQVKYFSEAGLSGWWIPGKSTYQISRRLTSKKGNSKLIVDKKWLSVILHHIYFREVRDEGKNRC